MKKLFLFLLIVSAISMGSFAQSVTLVPTAPGSPTKGSLYFDNASNVLKYWNGTVWISILNIASNTGWVLNGTDIYNNNTGKIGINTVTPSTMSKVHVNGYGVYGTGPIYQTSVLVDGLALANSSGVFAYGGWKGVYGYNLGNSSGSQAIGVKGTVEGSTYSSAGYGVFGEAIGTGPKNYGVYGIANGAANNNYGIYGSATGAGSYAGYFNGNVNVTGTLSAGVKPFKIDDPRDPENKYLYHSSIESNEMMNLYRGHVITDANGLATANLPSYFMVLNKDYEYQLTCIGQFAQAIVIEKIKNNQFVIKTDKPNVEVSWEVTGVRQDPVANAYRIIDEVEKPKNEKGTYLYPEAYGKDKTRSLNFMKEVTDNYSGNH